MIERDENMINAIDAFIKSINCKGILITNGKGVILEVESSFNENYAIGDRDLVGSSVYDLEREGLSPEQVLEFGVGRLRLACQEGDMVDGSVMAGQSAGLVHDVKPARDLMHDLIAEAEAALSSLSGLVG